jgi:hypothetical protein
VTRALAVVAAIAMVGLSLFIRSRIDDGGDGGGSGDGGSTVVLACVPELSDACARLAADNVEIRIADAGATAKSLTGIDGWVTLDPWPAIAGVSAAPVRVASSPLVIAAVAERAKVLEAHCGGTVGWKCLGDNLGVPWSSIGGQVQWGDVKVGVPKRSTASGLLIVGNAASGYFGRADIATNDFDADDGFGPWYAKVKRAEQSSDPFLPFIQQFPASFSAVGVIEAKERAGVGSRTSDVEVIRPSPEASAVVVVVPVTASREGRVRSLARSGAFRDELRAEGWTVDGVPDSNGLPDPGVLTALSTR